MRQTDPVIARSAATKQSILSFLLLNGLLRGACHRARVRATSWLAMTIVGAVAGSKATPSTSICRTITEERFMTKKLPKRGLPPMHPGELLRDEILPALDRSRAEIARLLGVSQQTLYDVLKEKQPVTPGMALRLGKLCGNGPDLWLNLQKRYDLHQAQQELGE
jgi:addiction module HigA family antidote